MNIAIRNIHKAGITGFAFHNYIVKLVTEGHITHLYFDEKPWHSDTFREVRRRYNWKELGLDKARIIHTEKELHKCDMLLNFDASPSDFTPAVKNFTGIKIFHIMDYFWNEPLSEKVERLKEYGIDYVFSYGSPDRYCSYFKKYAKDYTDKVIPIPFGYAERFKSYHPFSERRKKCVAVGSVRPLRFEDIDPHIWREPADLHAPETWFHKFRRMLVEHKDGLKDVMDSMLPEFPRYRDYTYDMVKKFNEYQMFTSDESVFYFPSAKTFEGPVSGTTMVCSDHPCFRDYGFADGVNCITHQEFSIDDFKKTLTEAIHNPKSLEKISSEGQRFVSEHYSHTIIANNLSRILENVYNAHNRGEPLPNLAEHCYTIYRGSPAGHSRKNTQLKYTEKFKQWFAYTYVGGIYMIMMESYTFMGRVWNRIKRYAPRITTRLYNIYIKTVYDTHPLDTLRKVYFRSTATRATTQGNPTPAEQQIMDVLRNRICELPAIRDDVTLEPPIRKWRAFCATLREYILAKDPRSFLLWDVIRNNMGYRANSRELRYLRRSKNWGQFHRALIEPKTILYEPFFIMPETTENAVRQAYHLAQFFEKTGRHVKDFDVIVDFGGGYGNMCRIVHSLGFTGTYIIYDWPEFSALQEFYLGQSNIRIPIAWNPRIVRGPSIVLINNEDSFKSVLASLPKDAKKLLIATWSLSEVSIALREMIVSAVNPDSFLIAYQHHFAGVINNVYFEKMVAEYPNIQWYRYSMRYLPTEKNRYLMGTK